MLANVLGPTPEHVTRDCEGFYITYGGDGELKAPCRHESYGGWGRQPAARAAYVSVAVLVPCIGLMLVVRAYVSEARRDGATAGLPV